MAKTLGKYGAGRRGRDTLPGHSRVSSPRPSTVSSLATAAASIQFLTQELPCAVGVAIKKKKKKILSQFWRPEV